MRVIFGLGNPGSEYEATRHNLGFAVVDAIAEKFRLSFLPGKGEYEIATSRDGSWSLVKPLTYMNNSGIAARELLERISTPAEESLTVMDDFDLPLGTLRMRRRGSAGTHNGLASMIWALETDALPRLRCGIGKEHKPAEKTLTAEYVLSPFTREERPIVREMIGRAGEVAAAFATDSLEKAFEVLSKQK